MNVSGELHTLTALPPGKEHAYPLSRWQSGSHASLEICWSENDPAGMEPQII